MTSTNAAQQSNIGLAAIKSANENVICTGSVDGVGVVSMGTFLASRLIIPVFQRRYCWGATQWDCLLRDSIAKNGHSIGRVMFYEIDPIPSVADKPMRRQFVITDGQQRCTSALLLLSAIQSLAYREGSIGKALAAKIGQVLIPDESALHTWMTGNSLEEGDMNFVALSPSFLDRDSFYQAILPDNAAEKWAQVSPSMTSVRESSPIPLQAKTHFTSRLRNLRKAWGCIGCNRSAQFVERLSGLTRNVLGLKWLAFPIHLNGTDDGTENPYLIFHRLALRDANMFAPGSFFTRPIESVKLSPADFIRNLLLASFRDEMHSLRMYHEYWVPLELAAAESDSFDEKEKQHHTYRLELILRNFIEQGPMKPPPPVQNQRRQGEPPCGQLYTDFETWLTARIETGQSSLNDSAHVEAVTQRVLEELKQFAFSSRGG